MRMYGMKEVAAVLDIFIARKKLVIWWHRLLRNEMHCDIIGLLHGIFFSEWGRINQGKRKGKKCGKGICGETWSEPKYCSKA